MASRKKRKPSRSRILRRWLAVAALALVAFLYYRPLRTYLDTRQTLASRRAEVQVLAARKHQLERELAASTTPAALGRQARRLGLVRPGERLFIVKGIPAWRAAQRGRVGGHG